VPPLGPAIPVIETEILDLPILLTFFTIALQTCSLTDPYFLMIFFETLRTLILD
ncbi:uncharacterized protein METZ01_LOCUS216205, partial [marine metagenome]